MIHNEQVKKNKLPETDLLVLPSDCWPKENLPFFNVSNWFKNFRNPHSLRPLFLINDFRDERFWPFIDRVRLAKNTGIPRDGYAAT